MSSLIYNVDHSGFSARFTRPKDLFLQDYLTKAIHNLKEYYAYTKIPFLQEKAIKKGLIQKTDRVLFYEWSIKASLAWFINIMLYVFLIGLLSGSLIGIAFTGFKVVQTVDPELALSIEAAVTPGPKTWLLEESDTKGSREGVMAAYQYALDSKYSFVANTAERDNLVAEGILVKLDGKYIKLIDVSEPYLLPVAASFVNRLGQTYAEKGCGKLEVTSALRTSDQQSTLSNGSEWSVHPTGMAVDLRRLPPESKSEVFCQKWLEKTLVSIEKNRRIDVTIEKNPSHFHVVVVTHDYSRWLEIQTQNLEPELKWLATGLYFEAKFDESLEGYRAIGWTIRNRVRSEEYPDTVLEVVAEGAAGRKKGGCQFSFMCDGKAEQIQKLCTQPGSIISQALAKKCDQRWKEIVEIAKSILEEPESNDPTGGAVLYYAAWMSKAPYWADTDMKKGTVKKFGNHIFACSVHRGSRACRT